MNKFIFSTHHVGDCSSNASVCYFFSEEALLPVQGSVHQFLQIHHLVRKAFLDLHLKLGWNIQAEDSIYQGSVNPTNRVHSWPHELGLHLVTKKIVIGKLFSYLGPHFF